ncbi:MAG: glycoside hydrolase family 88 protein [Clostridia bacterium]|nr:glycoside hydrolase family 88 protein [Clostridia bacterium]
MFWIITTVVLLLILFIFLYDFFPAFKNWLGRIKIGSLTDKKEWEHKTKLIVVEWLRKGAPKVPANENKRLKLIDDIKNANKRTQIDCWQDAALLKAATAIGGKDMQENVSKFLSKYIDPSNGKWNSRPQEARIDFAMLAYEILCCPYVDNAAVKPAMDYTAERLKAMYESHGSIPYNEHSADIRFVDTVGMVCPFLIKYAKEYDSPEYIKIAINQIKEYSKLGVHNDLKLPAHCFNTDNGAPLGIFGWARGCAWWALGLADSLYTLMEIDGHNSDKVFLLKTTLEAVYSIQKYVKSDGTVQRMLTVNSAEDSSAAAMLAYCFASVGKLIDDKSLLTSADKILGHLMTRTRRSGIIDFSQGDTRGIGFYSDSLCVMPAAQGFAVAAYKR